MPLVILPPLSMDIYISSIPSMKLHMDTTTSMVQWTLTVFIIGMAFGQIISGPLVDRFGRRPIGIMALALYWLGTGSCWLAQNIEMLIVSRGVQALGACGCYVMLWTVLRDLVEDSRRGRVFSYFNSLGGIAPIIAPIIGGYLVLFFGTWRASFAFLWLYASILLLLLFRFLPETLPKGHELSLDWKGLLKRFKHLLKHPTFLCYAFCCGVGMSALFTYFSVSPLLLIERCGVLESHYGFYFGANAITYTAGCLLASHWQKKHPPKWVLQWGCVLLILGSGLMLFWNGIWGLSVPALVFPNMMIAFGVGCILGPGMASALAPFGDMAGTASACLGSFQFLLAALVGGVVTGNGVETAMGYASTLLLLALTAMAWLNTMGRRL